jgi:hypothetical protein
MRSILQGTSIYDARFMQGFNLANSQLTISADYTMQNDPPPVAAFNGGTANRNIFLPPITGNTSAGFPNGRVHIIINLGTSNNLFVRVNSADNALTPIVGELLPSEMGIFYELNGTWFSTIGAGAAQTSQWDTPRNILDGGDATTNPFQRGVTFSAIANTLTYTADRWFAVGGASSSISVSQQAQTDVLGFSNSLRWGRGAGTNTAQINLGQVVETADAVRAQGQPVTFSFWAKAGAQFSAANSALTVQIISGTGTNQSAANMIAGTWTGQTNVVNTTQVLTSTATRYAFTGIVPNGCTQLGVQLSYAPTGTNNTTDTVDFYGFQLEVGTLTPFEHRDIELELALCQRYFFQLNEPASGVIVAAGQVSATNTELFVLSLPTPMRAAPTVTTTVGTFKSNSATAGIVAATGLTASGSHTTVSIGLTATGTGTAGQAATLQGGGGSGLIAASADF